MFAGDALEDLHEHGFRSLGAYRLAYGPRAE